MKLPPVGDFTNNNIMNKQISQAFVDLFANKVYNMPIKEDEKMKREVIKKILKSVQLSYRKAAPAFGCGEVASAAKFARGLKDLDDFILLCSYANIKIKLELPNGEEMQITKEDI